MAAPDLWARISPALINRAENRTVAHPKPVRRYKMSEATLDTLAAALSRPVHRPKSGVGSHLFIADKPSPFVAPKFNILEDTPEPLNREVIFVEASAAVGKSTIAKFMSATLGLAVLDLSKVPVATGSFKTLLQELEDPNKSDPLIAFHAGNCPIIIDALDEGRLLSGDTGIESFLETTAQFVQSDRTNATKSKLIFFGRFESIEIARTLIELAAPEISRATVQVGFFDKGTAWELIQAYAALTAKSSPDSIYLGHEEAAKQVISAYFDAAQVRVFCYRAQLH
ncbi:MAG TPA: hypothetical protein VGP48_15305 [Stellaceae bacterium]|jgi:hypothetical protein|nr:hypothetical protein [Stellaceae bacterium]